jgi:hypothetical protein
MFVLVCQFYFYATIQSAANSSLPLPRTSSPASAATNAVLVSPTITVTVWLGVVP